MDNKYVFANNLNYYMKKYCKTRQDISQALNISYYTVSDWVNGKKYPRMDKVEMVAHYFGILKSDLIEETPMENKNSPSNEIMLTEGEKALLELFRRVPENQQDMVLQMIRVALNTKE